MAGKLDRHFWKRSANGKVARRQENGSGETRRSVLVSLIMNCLEVAVLGIAAGVTGSVALEAQTVANSAEVGVDVFLLIGVFSSARAPDETHPLGYGRERFFWSLFAALAIFVGGGGLTLAETVGAILHPTPVHSYGLGLVVLTGTIGLDWVALRTALRPASKHAAELGISVRRLRHRSLDPAAVTAVVGGGCAVIGGCAALVGLGLSQATGSPTPDTIASALIGVLLVCASVGLLRTDRDLLSGRGVPVAMLREMARTVAEQPGVIDVPDLFAVVIGPTSVIVNGDVSLAENLDLRAAEQVIAEATEALRQRWSLVEFVYLTPVPFARPRRNAKRRGVPPLGLPVARGDRGSRSQLPT